MLTQEQTDEFKKMLQTRFVQVRGLISKALLKADEESYAELASQVGDLEDASLADLLADTALAEVDRHVEEVRDIDAALMRIADGSFGLCTDCGQPINPARLQVNPAASRCLTCQENYEERGHEQSRNRSL